MKREIRRAEKTCQAKIDESDRAMATFLKSHTRAQQSLQTECEELREKNNRLESLFNHLSSDPDKNLRRQLEIYEFALEDLRTNAPGFAPAWQHSLERANEAMAEGELGLLRWMPRSLLPNKEEKRGWFGRRLKQAEAVEVEVE